MKPVIPQNGNNWSSLKDQLCTFIQANQNACTEVSWTFSSHPFNWSAQLKQMLDTTLLSQRPLTSLYSHRQADGNSNESTDITPSSSIASNFLMLKICLHFVHFFPKGESNSPVRQWDSSILLQVTHSTSWIFPSPFWTR